MNDVDRLYKMIESSNLTLIGYKHVDERIKDKFLSKIKPYKMDFVDTSIPFLSHLRNLKIDLILENSNNLSKFILIDLNSFVGKDFKSCTNILSSKSRSIKSISDHVRIASISSGHRIIIESSLYRHYAGDSSSFSRGSSHVYDSDLAIKFENGGLSVVKNRYGDIFNIPYDILEKYLYI